MKYLPGHARRIPFTGQNRYEIDADTGVAYIELINRVPTGLRAVVDLCDLERVLQIRWRAQKPNDPRTYVVGTTLGGATDVRLHQFILGETGAPEVDHADGDRLNNRRSNLRPCTRDQNAYNNSKPSHGITSRFKGVSWDKDRSRWLAKITKGQKQIHIGRFATEEEAARAYDERAQELFGEFSKLNIPVE